MKAVKLSAEKLQLAYCLSVDSEKLTLWCWAWRISLSLFQWLVLSLVPKNPDRVMFIQTTSDVLVSVLNVLGLLSQLKASSNLDSCKVCLHFEFDAILSSSMNSNTLTKTPSNKECFRSTASIFYQTLVIKLWLQFLSLNIVVLQRSWKKNWRLRLKPRLRTDLTHQTQEGT